MFKGKCVVLLGLVLTGVLSAGTAETWQCKGNGLEITVSHDRNNDASLSLKQEIGTRKGKVPAGVHKGELSVFAWIAHRVWFFDVSSFIPDYDEEYHRYRGAVLSVILDQRDPKRGVLSIGQEDADPDLSGINHLREPLTCEKL